MLLIRHGFPIHKLNRDGTPADPPLSDLGRERPETGLMCLV